jgi:hypothetical protein
MLMSLPVVTRASGLIGAPDFIAEHRAAKPRATQAAC